MKMSIHEDYICYDAFGNNCWRPIMYGNIPSYRCDQMMINCNGHVWLISGIPDQGVYCFSTTSNLEWKKPRISGTGPTAVSGIGYAIFKEKIYFFGGIIKTSRTNQRNYSNDIYVFDTNKLSWEKISPKNPKQNSWPSPRGYTFVGAINDRFFLMFGGEVGSVCSQETWIFDIKSAVWTKLNCEVSPPAVSGSGPLPFIPDGETNPTHLIMSSGLSISGDSPFSSNMWIFDTHKLNWMFLPASNLVPRIASPGIVTHNGYLYQIGGIEFKHYPKSSNTFVRFPLAEALKDFMSRTPQNTSRVSLFCEHCGGYSQRTCSRCKKHTFCSEECEQNGLDNHMKDCILAGGREDPMKKQIEEQMNKIKQLENNLEQSIKKVENLKQSLDTERSEREKLSQEITHSERTIKSYENARETMQNQLNLFISIISDKEEQQKQEKVKNDDLVQELNKLRGAKKHLEDKLQQNQHKTKEIIERSQFMQEKLKSDAENATQRVIHLQEDLKEAERSKNIQKEILEQEKKDYEESKLCVICFEEQKNEVLVPCGHTFCTSCAHQLIQKKECPTCRKRITQRVKLYL
eukprot:TRINITY_DN2654_c1_g1_i1.p1 TRINITY_DN2654_c1_g1~~TRINITY_DN2654_c1_g1_i1.p1  ORF type:complete len:629 (+),score=133.64 TRINITY_DN2654_c1_g1_i1:164-1888(+)